MYQRASLSLIHWPIRAIGEMLGLPQADEERLRDWSNQLIGFTSSPDDPENQQFKEYFYDQIERHTVDPGDDLISIMVEAKFEALLAVFAGNPLPLAWGI